MIAGIPDYQAGKAKRLGRTVKLRPDWEYVKDEIMCKLLRRKFARPELGDLLLSTWGKQLIEGNYWHDNYWGVCHCDKCLGKGKNKLGNLLMKIREELDRENPNYRRYPQRVRKT